MFLTFPWVWAAATDVIIAEEGHVFNGCPARALADDYVTHGACFRIAGALRAKYACAIDALVLVQPIRTNGAAIAIRVPAWEIFPEGGAAEVIGEAGHLGFVRQAEIRVDVAEETPSSGDVAGVLSVGCDGAGEAAVVI